MKKFSFDESKHPRDHGRFTATGASPASAYDKDSGQAAAQRRRTAVKIVGDHVLSSMQRPQGEGRPPDTDKRSIVRASSVWNNANRIPEGKRGHEPAPTPAGSFAEHEIKWQIPKEVGKKDHDKLVAGLVSTIQANRKGAITQAETRGLIPEGTPKSTIHRAFNHAAMHALHAYGVLDYHAKMDEHLKAEMKPLEGFIRYAERRNRSSMLGEHRGKWQPYRAEFGQKFPTPKFKRGGNMEERLRVRPNQVLIKAEPIYG